MPGFIASTGRNVKSYTLRVPSDRRRFFSNFFPIFFSGIRSVSVDRRRKGFVISGRSRDQIESSDRLSLGRQRQLRLAPKELFAIEHSKPQTSPQKNKTKIVPAEKQQALWFLVCQMYSYSKCSSNTEIDRQFCTRRRLRRNRLKSV